MNKVKNKKAYFYSDCSSNKDLWHTVLEKVLANEGFEVTSISNLEQLGIDSGSIIFCDETTVEKLVSIQEKIKRKWIFLYTDEYIHESVIKAYPFDALNIKNPTEVIVEKISVIINDFIVEYNLGKSIFASEDLVELPLATGDILYVFAQRIKYIKAGGDYSDIIVEPGLGSTKTRFVIRENLKNLSERLSKNLFYRCHKSYIVSLHWVIDQHPYPQDTVHLKDGQEIPLARRRKLHFYNTYRSHS